LVTAVPQRLIRMVMPKVLPNPSVDAEIEAALSAHDKRRVLTLLLARFGEAIYRYAVAMTRDRDLAEDVRQQVFVEAYRDLERVAVPSALPTWIFGIARHRCFDAVDAQLRRNQRYKNDSPEDLQLGDGEPGRDLDLLVSGSSGSSGSVTSLRPITAASVVNRSLPPTALQVVIASSRRLGRRLMFEFIPHDLDGDIGSHFGRRPWRDVSGRAVRPPGGTISIKRTAATR
jgi:hypothetical protein